MCKGNRERVERAREIEDLEANKLLQYSDTFMKETHKLEYIRIERIKLQKLVQIMFLLILIEYNEKRTTDS